MYRQILITVLLACCAALTHADQKQVFGDYEVHYSVLNATFLPAEIASRYGIVRGKDRAIVNIAVRRRLPGGETEAQAAVVTGKSSDLVHSIPLSFEEIRESGAIYYLAGLRISDKEPRSFEIKVQPDPAIAPYTLKFTKTLYHEE
ncbi:MAG TPA: DUF4426 domain-containing protein [Spongiibacteraceae bacterium]|nr:DUF4426 domain-containing protein [Spongiibacteraceae bacterium]